MEWQPAAEIETGTAFGVADQHVRDAAAFRPRQPGGDKCIAGIDLRVHPERPAAQNDADPRDSGVPELPQLFQNFTIVVDRKLHVAVIFGIGLLAIHDDRDVGPIRSDQVGTVDEPAAG